MVQIDGFNETIWGIFPDLDEPNVFDVFMEDENRVVTLSRAQSDTHKIVIEITMTTCIASVSDEALVKNVRLGTNEENASCMDFLESKVGFIPAPDSGCKQGLWLIFNDGAIEANCGTKGWKFKEDFVERQQLEDLVDEVSDLLTELFKGCGSSGFDLGQPKFS